MDRTKPIAVGADHAGAPLKAEIAGRLAGLGFAVTDLGTDGEASVDYPDFGAAVAEQVRQGHAGAGIVVCGTGIGIAIAANRFAGVRAAVCHDVTTARLARRHNDANILALGARVVGREVAMDCVDAFLTTDYDGGRHDRRVRKLDALGR
jgi:ribose 5-phosphate isomerase B